MNDFGNTFKDKVVLITGNTGFKGSWLSLWMIELGAKVVGISNNVPTQPSNYEVCQIEEKITQEFLDITDFKKVQHAFEKWKPDFVFHMAAQALVKESYSDPLETFKVNGLGTANILEALRNIDKEVIAIIITSDKAYDNVEWIWGYRENDRIGGKDPYSASKGVAELVIRSYVDSFFTVQDCDVRLGIVRAGNVIGGGDWAADRIVPDCMKAWSLSDLVDIRSPNATRPWQHVLEPLSGYISLASELSQGPHLHGEAYNFGPSADQNFSVRELIDEMTKHWDSVVWNDTSGDLSVERVYEAGLLKLNCDKALAHLLWEPTMTFEETVKLTVEWYKAFYQKDRIDIHEFTLNQIRFYMTLAEERQLRWASDD